MATVLKVVLLGESGVGKTCIINKFISGIFDPEVTTSLSAQFVSKTIEFKDLKQTIKFDIWDTAGQEKYRSLAKIFYKDAKVICLCYDITSLKSFTVLKDYWYEEQVKTNSDSDVIYAVVANKNDLYEISQVKDEEGKAFARQIKGIFQSTSAKSDSGIGALFENIGRKYFNPDFDSNEAENKQKEEYQQKKNEKMQQKKQVVTSTNRGVKLDAGKVKNDNQQKKGGCC